MREALVLKQFSKMLAGIDCRLFSWRCLKLAPLERTAFAELQASRIIRPALLSTSHFQACLPHQHAVLDSPRLHLAHQALHLPRWESRDYRKFSVRWSEAEAHWDHRVAGPEPKAGVAPEFLQPASAGRRLKVQVLFPAVA